MAVTETAPNYFALCDVRLDDGSVTRASREPTGWYRPNGDRVGRQVMECRIIPMDPIDPQEPTFRPGCC